MLISMLPKCAQQILSLANIYYAIVGCGGEKMGTVHLDPSGVTGLGRGSTSLHLWLLVM